MRIICLAAFAACLCVTGCAPAPAVPSAAEPAFEVPCEDPRPKMCTKEYRPVCGLRDTGVRCVTTPCDSTEWRTFGNACTACSDTDVYGYSPGECSEEGG